MSERFFFSFLELTMKWGVQVIILSQGAKKSITILNFTGISCEVIIN